MNHRSLMLVASCVTLAFVGGATRVAAQTPHAAQLATLDAVEAADSAPSPPAPSPKGEGVNFGALAPREARARDAASFGEAPSAFGEAQPAGGGRRGSSGGLGLRVNVFFNVGSLSLAASESFDAVLGKKSGLVFGGGGELTTRLGIFVRGDVSRFSEDGERVFVSNGQVFKLGIPLTVTMTPIEFTGGYRFFTQRHAGQRGGIRIQPYVGAGAGVLRYKESSKFDQPGEQVGESYTSYHVLVGVDVPVTRRLAGGVEYQHRWVRDAIGAGGVSKEFNETDLGGDTVRAQVRFYF